MGVYSLADLMIERLGDEVLVCDSSRGMALQLTGDTADVVRRFQDTGSLNGAPQEIVDDLVKVGILVPTSPDRHVSRRVLISSGAGVLGLGIVGLALPNAAAAASGDNGGPGGDGDGGTDPTTNPLIFQPTSSNPNTFVIWWTDDNGDVAYTWTVSGDPTPAPTSGSGSGFASFTLTTWGTGQTISLVVTSGSKSVTESITQAG